jgi:hypothetical protein
MISKEDQTEILKLITNALQGKDLGIVVVRDKNNSLILVINDTQTLKDNLHKLTGMFHKTN